MNSKHKKTLASIFANARTIPFRNVESLLKALECDMIEAEGSRVTFTKAGNVWHVHRPHPGNEIKPYQVKAVRRFLDEIGVKP